MKAYVITEPGCIREKERPEPEGLLPDEVLVRVHTVGICGSDMHIFHGTNPFATYPRVWGHEFAGTVVSVGSGVRDLKAGDHVAAEPYLSCGHCYACRKGRGNVCSEVSVFGVHRDGGCRELVVMKRAKVHAVRADVPWKLAALAEPLTVGFQAADRGRVEKDDLVLIEGAGTIGLSALIAVKSLGARAVITDLYEEKLAYAEKFGADYTVCVRGRSLEEIFAEIGEPPNVILDGVCTKESLEEAVELVSPAGRVVELGYGNIRSEIPHVTLMRKEADVCGTRLQAGKFPQAIRYIEEHGELLSDFVTQVFPAEKMEEAFRFVEKHPGEVRKAQVVLEQE